MMNYWGFDLGDGESTLARVGSTGVSYPEIVDVDGKKVTITVWAVMRNGEVRIGENAARSAASAVRSAARFKRRFLDVQSDSAALIRDFSARVFESLRDSGALVGGEKSNSVYVGCPAGWDAENRARYRRIFETIGFPNPKVVSESRAVMVGAIQSNSVRDYVDLRTKSVLVIDIGSSTTDFAYINKGKETEIRTGGEVSLGGGVMDELLLEASVQASGTLKPSAYVAVTPEELAAAFNAKLEMGLAGGMLVTNPIPEEYSLDPDYINSAIDRAVKRSLELGIKGKETTPFLLAEIKDITGGNSLDANIQLVLNNARLAARTAACMVKL